MAWRILEGEGVNWSMKLLRMWLNCCSRVWSSWHASSVWVRTFGRFSAATARSMEGEMSAARMGREGPKVWESWEVRTPVPVPRSRTEDVVVGAYEWRACVSEMSVLAACWDRGATRSA